MSFANIYNIQTNLWLIGKYVWVLVESLIITNGLETNILLKCSHYCETDWAQIAEYKKAVIVWVMSKASQGKSENVILMSTTNNT